ncbi:hypothetical protein BBAD15_g7724 [Beauveria bassiana D1-5]|uniref:Uncharacterized protein n=1 Tax=Beauveria bassiana D1-5 TaxID=1245745 RepID=A0A0A2VGC7_BEABA|nr:hypothetical protein BBAD15_g7724 [Beauveria bassiana D1-5]
MTKPRPSDVFFFSCPRTLSNLLVKLLSQQQGWEGSGYYFHSACMYAVENFSYSVDAEAPPEKRQEFARQLREGFAKMEAARDKAHRNVRQRLVPKKPLRANLETLFPVRSHQERPIRRRIHPRRRRRRRPHTNPTMLTDAYLVSFVPIFLIRHPALMVDSWFRASTRAGHPPDPCLTTRASIDPCLTTRARGRGLGLARELYDWYAAMLLTTATSDESRSPPPPTLGCKGVPIVVDADDVLEGDTVPRLTAVIGMDPAQVLRGWEAQSTEGMVPLDKSYMQGICDSTGIDTSKSARRLDIEAMYRSWRETYGDEVAEYMVKVTESDLPNYEYMKSKKM